jgi:hypothetical protein
VVRGQDVGCCGFGSWQLNLLDVLECDPRGHAMAGQVERLTSISAIVSATAVLITGLDVPKPILVGNILRKPQDQCTRTVLTLSARINVDSRDRLLKPIRLIPFYRLESPKSVWLSGRLPRMFVREIEADRGITAGTRPIDCRLEPRPAEANLALSL